MPSKATIRREWAKENTKRRMMGMKALTIHQFISAMYPQYITGRSNSARRPTKAQKRANASKRSKQKRVAKALREFLKTQNPAMKCAGAKIRRNKGSITIIPIKLPKRASR
jgi:hypothetical protein